MCDLHNGSHLKNEFNLPSFYLKQKLKSSSKSASLDFVLVWKSNEKKDYLIKIVKYLIGLIKQMD